MGQTGELGGAELVLLDLACHARARCTVLLLADGPLRGRLTAAGVEVRVLDGGSLLDVSRQGGRLRTLASLPAVLRTARRLAAVAHDYDVLYPNSQKAAVVALLAGGLARRPVVWHLHDILSDEHFAGLQRRVVVTLANRLARRVIANSQAARDAFVAAGGRADRVGVVPNGIDPRLFEHGDDAEAKRLRDRLGLGQRKLVGLFGRLSPWKGQHVLVEALPRLVDVHALIVGGALFGEDDYRREVMRQADALGVADRVHWLGFRDDIPQLMHAVDLVVHTSTAPEPFGRVIVEAMLARRPVLATAMGASGEVLGAGHAGLVRPGDPVALADAVERVFAMPADQLAGQVARSHARALALFSASGMLAGVDRELALAW